MTKPKAAWGAAALPPAAAGAVVIAVGAGMGVATSLLQARLNYPALSLVDAASPWLAASFAMGSLWRRPRAAASAGLCTGLLELASYYLTAAARGYPAGGGTVLFWAACALIGGPLFGLAGWSWWSRSARFGALGAAVLPGAFVVEAAVNYGWRLHYFSSAILFGILAAGLFALLGIRGRQHYRAARWLVVALPAGTVAYLLLGLVYSGTF